MQNIPLMIFKNNLLKAGSDIIVDKITKDIHEAEAFSTIANETKDINRVEQLFICFRCVNRDNYVNERGFLASLTSMTLMPSH